MWCPAFHDIVEFLLGGSFIQPKRICYGDLQCEISAWENVWMACAKEKENIRCPAADSLDFAQSGIGFLGGGLGEPREIEPTVTSLADRPQGSYLGTRKTGPGEILVCETPDIVRCQGGNKALEACKNRRRAGNGNLLAGDDLGKAFEIGVSPSQGDRSGNSCNVGQARIG